MALAIAVRNFRSGFRRLPIQIKQTYFRLRYGMAALALVLPPYLALRGIWFEDMRVQESLSAYYHAMDGAMRDEFVGALVGLGIALIVYKGFSFGEDWWLNFAGVFIIGVAVVPMGWQCEDSCSRISQLHGIFAVLFFVCIAWVAFFESSNTLNDDQTRWKWFYRGLSVFMAVVVIVTVLLTWLLQRSVVTFVLETAAVWMFCLYWIIKSIEIGKSNADSRIDSLPAGKAPA